jgi:hypothetical protein
MNPLAKGFTLQSFPAAGADAWIIECLLSKEEIQCRLERRSQEGTSASDAHWQRFHQLQWE